MMEQVIVLLETLGGVRPLERYTASRAVSLGCWWFVLLLATLAFAGRNTKFVYVDF